MARGRDDHIFLVCPHCFRSKWIWAGDIQKALDRVVNSLWRPQRTRAAQRSDESAPGGEGSRRKKAM
jgi:Zn-finger nucleic acid-binding protein